MTHQHYNYCIIPSGVSRAGPGDIRTAVVSTSIRRACSILRAFLTTLDGLQELHQHCSSVVLLGNLAALDLPEVMLLLLQPCT